MFKLSQNSNLKSQNFLEDIVKVKKTELVKKIQRIHRTRLSKKRIGNPDFRKLFLKRNERIKLIAEIKFASPTISKLGTPDELLYRAKQYANAGADAISIITEKHFFKGDVTFIPQIKSHVSLPVLQKDFVIEQQQIYEACEIGSDALLLIARLVDKKKLQEYVDQCFALQIEPVVEINNEEDLEKVIATNTKIVAVNARDLETFEIDINKACRLIKKISYQFITLGFSGVNSKEEILLYKNAGVAGVLIGTRLMKTKDIEGFIRSLHL